MAKTKSITTEFTTSELFEIEHLLGTKIRVVQKGIDSNPHYNNQFEASYILKLRSIRKKISMEINDRNVAGGVDLLPIQ